MVYRKYQYNMPQTNINYKSNKIIYKIIKTPHLKPVTEILFLHTCVSVNLIPVERNEVPCSSRGHQWDTAGLVHPTPWDMLRSVHCLPSFK